MSISFTHYVQELLTSGIVIVFLMVIRILLIRMIRRNSEILTKEQRRWINRIRNGTIILVFVVLVMIWAPQLQTFALSLTAFAVALVVALRDMLLCLIGSLFRVSTNPYKVGDWITVDGVVGEVMEINAFTTRIEQIDTVNKTYQFTGKSLSIPNSKLFTTNIENQNFIKNYTFYDVSAVVQFNDMNPSALMEMMKTITDAHIAPFAEEAARFMKRVSRKAGIDLPGPEAAYGLRTTDLGHFVFSARVFVPTQRANELGESITREFLSAVYEVRGVTSKEKQIA